MLAEMRSAAQRVSAGLDLRALMADCHRLLSERGQANSQEIARGLVERFGALPATQQRAFFERLATQFNPDPVQVLAGAQAYAAKPDAQHLIRLAQLVEPPRQELLRRINRAPGGTASIVHMRRQLLAELPRQPALHALDADLLHLLSSWFNPGFLELRRVDWNSPARLLEQLIEHEAVHEIDGWDDLRRRLCDDRRCFAFFHPQLPGEPLIFVEVALLPAMPTHIGPLIDKASPASLPQHFQVAAFYSISNCEPGLRGVSLGNFLIKRVAKELQRELPQLKRFCTLSPIPGFGAWLRSKNPLATLPGLTRVQRERADAAYALLARSCGDDFTPLSNATTLAGLTPAQQTALTRLCAAYFLHGTMTPQGDAVARFHLDNGARLERINWAANLSGNGLRQSCGLMVNYLYDLNKIDDRHEAFTQNEVIASRVVSALL